MYGIEDFWLKDKRVCHMEVYWKMKKVISLLLVLVLVICMTGCDIYVDEEAAKELLQEKANDVVDDIFSNNIDKTDYEPCTPAIGCKYRIITENKNRVVRLECLICGGELVDTNIDFDTFKKYDVYKGCHTNEELDIMLAIYKAQNIGPEMLTILETLEGSCDVGVKKGLFKTTVNSDVEEVDSEITDLLKGFKSNFDACYAVLENEGNIKNCKNKDEFLQLWLGQENAEFIKGGETVEDICGKLQTASSIYRLAGLMHKKEETPESYEKTTLLMIETVNHILGLLPEETMISLVYSQQLEALKQSCEKYFKSCDNYKNLLLLYDEYIEDDALQTVFKADDEDDEADVFLQAFSGGREARNCWSESHMPSLEEMLVRLSETDESGKTVYERLEPKVQLLVTKYIEYRMHYEFQKLTGITLECYYDLMKPSKFFGLFLKAPWEKEVKKDEYRSFLPDN